MTDMAGSVANATAWTSAAAAVGRKSGLLTAEDADDAVWAALTRTTVDGIAIPALGLPNPTSIAVATPPRARRCSEDVARSWDVRACIDDPNPTAAHTHALANLEGGAASLWLRLGPDATRPEDIAEVLAGVHLALAPVVLDHRALTRVAAPDAAAMVDQGLAAADALLQLADASDATSGPMHPDSSFGFDPIGPATLVTLISDSSATLGAAGAAREITHGARDATGASAEALQQVGQFASLAQTHGVRALTVDATVVHDAGGGSVAEIGYSIAVGVAYLRALVEQGLSVDDAARLIDFRYAATDHQSMSIAKLRAARLAWRRVCELSGCSPDVGTQYQHAVTSRAMFTHYDRHVNMLRSTIAAFAAGVGMADAVTVLPFDSTSAIPDEFSHRMARNVAALLMGESGVADVADAAGGSYAIEALTADLAESGWQAFTDIEARGGILEALADGSLTGRVDADRGSRLERIATRHHPITGVSEFPRADDDPSSADSAHAGRWTSVQRWAEPFETMRENPPDEHVLLIRIGSEAAASARVQFTRNLLLAGGVGIDEAATGDADLRVTHRVVMLVGADRDYREQLAPTAQAAHDNGALATFLAGRPAVLDSPPDGLFTANVAAGDDVLAFLTTVRQALGRAS